MTNRTRLRLALLGPTFGLAIGIGCVGEVERTYFDDLGDAASDATVFGHPDASTDALGVEGDDAGDAGDAARDGGDGSVDAAPDCGPLDVPANCGACGVGCDGTHVDGGLACAAGACVYGACNPGWADCVRTLPNANGCETPTTTTSNCSACGAACDTTHSVEAGCTGTTCSYGGCSPGWTDCNQTAPNTNGCETPTSATVHNNGLENYNDCTPVGTYTAALAMKACIAYTDAAVQCVSFPCQDPDSGPIICSAGATTKPCICWSFSGNNVGLWDNGGMPPGTNSKNCFCPDKKQGDTTWN